MRHWFVSSSTLFSRYALLCNNLCLDWFNIVRNWLYIEKACAFLSLASILCRLSCARHLTIIGYGDWILCIRPPIPCIHHVTVACACVFSAACLLCIFHAIAVVCSVLFKIRLSNLINEPFGCIENHVYVHCKMVHMLAAPSILSLIIPAMQYCVIQDIRWCSLIAVQSTQQPTWQSFIFAFVKWRTRILTRDTFYVFVNLTSATNVIILSPGA